MSQDPSDFDPPGERSLIYWPALGCLGFLVFPLAIVAFVLAMPIFGTLWVVGSLYPLDPQSPEFDAPSDVQPLPQGRRQSDSAFKLPFHSSSH